VSIIEIFVQKWHYGEAQTDGNFSQPIQASS
jgi:hypothetical protein